MSEIRDTEIYDAADAAWDNWHDCIGAVPDEDDDYIPTMSIQWETAFRAGVRWMQDRGQK